MSEPVFDNHEDAIIGCIGAINCVLEFMIAKGVARQEDLSTAFGTMMREALNRRMQDQMTVFSLILKFLDDPNMPARRALLAAPPQGKA